MGVQRNVDEDGATGEEGWHDDAAPTSPSDLDTGSELDEDELEDDGLEDDGEGVGGAFDDEDDAVSGAGYGNNSEVPANPD